MLGEANELFGVDGRVWRLNVATGDFEVIAGAEPAGVDGCDLLATRSSGDEGPAKNALVGANDITRDRDGNLYIAEPWSRRIRKIPPCVFLNPPVYFSPSNGSAGVPTSISLMWNPILHASRYDVYLDTVNPPTVLAGMSLPEASFTPGNLQPLTTYYWRVVAKGDPYCEPQRIAESEVSSFTTASECREPGQ